jgi:HK97 family phage prohead protease
VEHKNVPFSLKQADDALMAGLVKGYAAVFGNVDDGDDLIDPGAFTKTIAESGGRVKMGWQHAAPFGVTTYIAEVGRDSLL